MKSLILKDKDRRHQVSQYELKRRSLKSIIKNNLLSKEIKLEAMNDLNRLPRDSSYVRVKNRCVISGRGKSVYRFFKMSRIQMREHIMNGLVSGATKSSW